MSELGFGMLGRTNTADDDGARRAWIGVVAPVLALVFVIIMLAVAALAGFARQQDQAFTQSSSRLVSSAVDGRARALASVTLDYANWNQAYRAITLRWDGDWVENNIYSSVADSMIVFRGDGSVRYAWFDEPFESQANAITLPVVRVARAVPGFGRLALASTPAGTVARSFVQINGRLAIVTVAPVTREDAARLQNPGILGRDYLALVDIVTDDEVAEMGASLDLHDMAFSIGAASASDDFVHHDLTAANGDAAGQLVWRHARPGAVGFQSQVWPVVIALLSIGALTVLVARLLVARQIGVVAHASAAMEASRAKSEFLTKVSHELRTPLNAIIGYAEMIQEENQSDETRGDANRIIVAARHLGHLLNDIIDQSRIDSNRIKLQPQVLPVAGMLVEVQGLMRPAARAGGVELTATSSANADYVFADHVRLRQCLLNLLGNAIKFSPRGSVVLSATAESVGGQAMVVFNVRDTGIGIDQDEIDQIFRPFGQANASINKTFGGTGLGLSIARDLARAMGGDITVVSDLGIGSTFSLVLPAATAAALRAA